MPTDQQREETVQYLKTNGPPPGAFDYDSSLEVLLEGKTDLEKRFYRSQNRQEKQNEWLITETIGLKGSHRIIQSRLADVSRTLVDHAALDETRFSHIDSALDVFTKLREKWLDKQKVRRNVAIAVVTLLLFPFISVLAVECIKHWLHWP